MPSRSPVIFWLLLAATLAVDAVVFVRMATEPYPALPYTAIPFYALILSQLSIACIWTACRDASTIFKCVVPILSVASAALLTATFSNDPTVFQDQFFYYLGWYALHAASLLAALWLLQRTAFWRRHSDYRRAWQFSMGQLLIVMTGVALLVGILRSTPVLSDYRWPFLISVFLPVTLAVACVLIWRLPWHWLLRLAAALGCAILLGACYMLVTNLNIVFFHSVMLLIQGIMISLWLALGPILPSVQSSAIPGAN